MEPIHPIHITPGGSAADSLREALALAGGEEQIVDLRDDLAVGPLDDVDESPAGRAAFWRTVFGDDATIDFSLVIESDMARIAALVGSDAPVLVWHGQSAADQLMLRRIAYHLRKAPHRLFEVSLSLADLPPSSRAATRDNGATAVGMFAAQTLLFRRADAMPIAVARAAQLASEWDAVKNTPSDARAWRAGKIEYGSFAPLDAVILRRAEPQWRDVGPLIGELMVTEVGFFVTDALACWRCRELAAAGLVQLSGEPSGPASWRGLQIRAASAAGPQSSTANPTT
ncbi:DUF1835 domain-containing protein [Trinickia sp. LjRoot230]|uniref:DUF1835 domain-containing protein n=1 Tax=Trinickia sp. LjRoot230 TaxID=3342288 RepID=UPI003ECDF939